MVFIELQFKRPPAPAHPLRRGFRAMVPVLSSLLWASTNLLAGDGRMRIDPEVDLRALALRPGTASVRSSVANGRVLIDASAVLDGTDCTKLAKNAVDFDRYTAMGMPNLRASRIVERTPDSRFLFVWSHMVLASPIGEQSSRHYLEVERLPEGSRWSLVPRRSGWQETEDSRFEALDGSWYAIPFPGDPADCSQGRVYVRYWLSMDLDSSVPSGLVDLVVGKSLRSGVTGVIERLAVHSRR